MCECMRNLKTIKKTHFYRSRHMLVSCSTGFQPVLRNSINYKWIFRHRQASNTRISVSKLRTNIGPMWMYCVLDRWNIDASKNHSPLKKGQRILFCVYVRMGNGKSIHTLKHSEHLRFKIFIVFTLDLFWKRWDEYYQFFIFVNFR